MEVLNSALTEIYCVIVDRLFICLIYHIYKEMISLMKVVVVVVVMCAHCQCPLCVPTLGTKHFECVV